MKNKYCCFGQGAGTQTTAAGIFAVGIWGVDADHINSRLGEEEEEEVMNGEE